MLKAGTLIVILIYFIIKPNLMIQEIEQEQLQRLEEVRLRIRDQGLQPSRKTKSKTDETFILNCLKNHFIFYNLSEKELGNVKDNMFWLQLPESTEVFRQGTVGSCFFIIVSGIVEIIVDGEVIKNLKGSEGFGELALLYDIDRPSTVRARQKCCFWAIDKTSFRQAVEEIVINQFQQNQKYLQGMAFYQFLNNRQKQKVASSFVTLKYYKGQNIIQQGDPGSAFYIIKDGTASLIQGNLEDRKIYRGESFGLNSLYYNTMRKMTVRAEDEVVVQVLGRETLAKIIGVEYFRETMFKNYVKYILQKNRQIFSLIKKDQQKFFENMKIKYYKTNEIVFKKGSTVHKLVVIVEGKIKKFRSANFLAESGQTWGESYLTGNEVRLEDDVVVETQSVLIQLSLQNIKLVQSSMVGLVKKLSELKTDRQKLDLENVNVICEIQQNEIGKVLLLKLQNRLLAGKLIRKKQIQKQNLGMICKQALQVEGMVSHPFIPMCYQVEQGDTYFLKLSEYIKGQNFFDSIRQIGLLSTLDCQFYAASIILILQYMMSHQIVIRDLKPDNFVVDEKGYLYLISLGSAKSLERTHKTSTVIGTPHYMAPQVVLGKEYNELVDLWSLGVMLYELMVGELPFGANTQNPYEIYQMIIQGDTSFPRNFKDRRAKKIIESMLSLNPEARHSGSFSTLKSSSWFQNIIWDDLLEKNTHPPYKPSKIKQFRPGQPTKLNAYLKFIS